jgi:hypothetical protein
MRLRGLVYLGLGAALAVAACSGDELFSGGGRTTPTGTGGSTTSTQSGGGGTDTTTTSATGAMGGGGSTTTTTNVGGAGAFGGYGGSGGAPAEIPCNYLTCLGPDVCCLSDWGPQYDVCGSPGSCDANSIQIECNGPSDCGPNDVCCGRWVQDGQTAYYLGVECSLTCVADFDSQGVTLCDTQDDCLIGTCTPSALLPDGFSYCYIG